MAHPKPHEVHKVGTSFKWKRTGESGVIVGYNMQKDQTGFLNYYVCFPNRPNAKAIYAVYHDDVLADS